MCLSMGVDEVLHHRSRLLRCGAPHLWLIANDLVWVFPIGKAHDPDINERRSAIGTAKLGHEAQQLGSSEGTRLRASSINVVRQQDLRSVAQEKSNLSWSKCGAHARHNVGEARLMRHQCVGVSLNKYRGAALAHRRLRLIDEIEGARLVEELCRCAVEILRTAITALVVFRKEATAEAGNLPIRITDRKDHASTEAVIGAATAIAFGGEADGGKLRGCCAALCGERLGAGVP